MSDYDDKNLRLFKKKYEKPVMSDKVVFEMEQRINQGKKTKRSMSKKKAYKGWAIAAVAALAILILPNTSSSKASGMESIPLFGGFFK
ncbi:MAG TPA: hypothetical protein GXZ96_04490 [Firmicutes bacterium]|nr:hypothetical protein [Bacillota bacterium]